MDERKKDAEGTEADEDDNKSEPGPRRCGSPATSVASAVLEWDPSADVGAMASSSSEMMPPPGPSHSNQRSVLEGFSECDVVYGPKMYELEGGNGRSRPGSRRAQHQKLIGCDSSTPSSSPAPLGDLQYSPVIPQSSYSHEHNTVGQAESISVQNIGAVDNPGSRQDTSDEDNNDDLTEGRRTPGRAVSESSTDWEYDPEKNDHTKSLSNWQTSGVTRSEIEYQTRKKNGSSTSIASSVLMLKVETKDRSPDQGSPGNKRKKSKKPPLSSSSHFNSEESSDFDRRLKKILQEREARRRKQAQEASSSNPSTMCGLVGDYVDMLEELDSSKENLQYDVLKKHREYHLAQVRNQIATVEKLNLKLLEVEKERKRFYREYASRHMQDRKGGGDADYRRRNKRDAEGSAAANQQSALATKNALVAELAEYFRNEEELSLKKNARKSQKKEYSSDPIMGSESARMLRNIPSNFQDSSRGISMPYLPSKNSQPKESDRRRPVSKREEEFLDQRKTPKVKSSSLFKPVALPAKNVREESVGVRQRKKDLKLSGITNPILKELISKILVPDELLKQSGKQKTSVARGSRRFVEKASSSDDKTETEEEGSGSRASDREFASRRAGRGRSDRSRKEKVKQKKEVPEEPKPKKPPVGFYVPLACDENGISAPGSGGSGNQQYKWLGDQRGENGLYDIKAPMSVHDCLKRNKPDCFESIKDRDDIILHRKLDRKIRHETFIGQFLDSELQHEEVDDYMDNYFLKCDPDQEKRAMYYMEKYEKAKAHGVPDGRRLISSKEMKERTARFLIYDMLEKQKKEALQRKKQAIRNSQRNFSDNLRRYRQKRNVNVPDQFELNYFK